MEMLITPAGLVRLTEELEQLRTTGRRRIAERIREAISTDADASANADYLIAREEQAELEARIARLEVRLADATIVEADGSNNLVDLGERVRLRDLETGARLEIELVGPIETDVESGRISTASPVGQALIGRRRGDVAVVDTPMGRRRLRIVAIAQPDPVH